MGKTEMCAWKKKRNETGQQRGMREKGKDVIQKEKPRQIIIPFFFFVFVGFGKNVRDENVVKKKTYRKEKKRGSKRTRSTGGTCLCDHAFYLHKN